MVTPRGLCVLFLLALAAGLALEEAPAAVAQQSPAASQQTSEVERLEALLEQTVGETVLSALCFQRQQQQSGEATTGRSSCQRRPEPLSSQGGGYIEPMKRACARSCLQLRDQGGAPQDGVYWFTGMPVPVLCDFSHDGGGWTLLLTAVTKTWDLLSAMGRREGSPSLKDDYSILRYANAIRDLGSGGRFAYRIEAQAQAGRRRWGGVWFAPRRYSFVDETGSQTDVRLVRRFDKWDYKDTGIERRMPWLRAEGGDHSVLTTTAKQGIHWWGTLASHRNAAGGYQHSPWVHQLATQSGTVLYWMREDEL